jgi:UDP-N-acetyl-D-galactosamine dehydrogenase
VGGHCIGVDPYYLTFKAESLGYHPHVILAGRRINDNMGKVMAEQTVKKLIATDRTVKGAKVLILGWKFKENVPDIRNTRVINIYRELVAYGLLPMTFEPEADAEEVKHEYGFELIADVAVNMPYSVVILAVKHRQLVIDYTLPRLKELGGDRTPVLIDVKGFFDHRQMENAGFPFWQP